MMLRVAKKIQRCKWENVRKWDSGGRWEGEGGALTTRDVEWGPEELEMVILSHISANHMGVPETAHAESGLVKSDNQNLGSR